MQRNLKQRPTKVRPVGTRHEMRRTTSTAEGNLKKTTKEKKEKVGADVNNGGEKGRGRRGNDHRAKLFFLERWEGAALLPQKSKASVPQEGRKEPRQKCRKRIVTQNGHKEKIRGKCTGSSSKGLWNNPSMWSLVYLLSSL